MADTAVVTPQSAAEKALAEPSPMGDLLGKLHEAAPMGRAQAAPPQPAPEAKAEPKPEAKAEPKAGEVATPEPIDPTKLTFEKGYPSKAEQWKQVKARAEAAERRAKELEDKVSSLGDLDQLKTLADRYNETKNLLRQVSIERDPEFVAQYNQQRAAFIENAKGAVGQEHVEEVTALLERHGAAALPYIRDFANKNQLDQFAMVQLGSAVAGLQTLETNRKNAIAQSVANFDRYTTEQMQAQRREQERLVNERKAALEERIKETDNPLLRKVDGADAHNAQVEESIAVAKRVVSGDLDAEELSRVALMAGTYTGVLKWGQEQSAKVAALEAELAQLRGGQPRPGLGGSAPGTGGAADDLPPIPGPGEYNPQLSVAALLDQTMRKRGF